MARCTAAPALVVALALAGCSLNPFPGDTLPPIQDLGVRITEGPGAADAYQSVIEVVPPSEVQVQTIISDGESATFTLPRQASPSLEVMVTDGSTTRSVSIVSVDGEPLTMSRPFEFDPGYVGIEQESGVEALTMRASTSRLTGAGQGEVPFTFKTKVR